MLSITVILTANSEATPIVFSVILILLIGGFTIYHVLVLRKILQHAESFEKCDGRIVSISSTTNRGYAKMVVEFKDFMNEDYDMESHSVFTVNEIGDHIGQGVVIYFSKEYPIVLIDQYHLEQIGTDDALDEEKNIW